MAGVTVAEVGWAQRDAVAAGFWHLEAGLFSETGCRVGGAETHCNEATIERHQSYASSTYLTAKVTTGEVTPATEISKGTCGEGTTLSGNLTFN
jgi:hypothetical protein